MGALWELPGISLGALWELVAVAGICRSLVGGVLYVTHTPFVWLDDVSI
jgi:hypothetical protein